jgi:hypothetical protein
MYCREFGPVFSWMLGPTKMTTVVDYDAIKSLLQQGDSKVRWVIDLPAVCLCMYCFLAYGCGMLCWRLHAVCCQVAVLAVCIVGDSKVRWPTCGRDWGMSCWRVHCIELRGLAS